LKGSVKTAIHYGKILIDQIDHCLGWFDSSVGYDLDCVRLFFYT